MTGTNSITGPQQIVLMTLRDHPHLNTPQLIDSGPYSIEQIDVQEYAQACADLAAMDPPRVLPLTGGGWEIVNPSDGE